jgi:hypothetical protein
LLGFGLAEVRRFLVTRVHRDHYTMASAVPREFGKRVALAARWGGHAAPGAADLGRAVASAREPIDPENARRLRWTRRERRFDELDFSRCLAVTETLAHLVLEPPTTTPSTRR